MVGKECCGERITKSLEKIGLRFSASGVSLLGYRDSQKVEVASWGKIYADSSSVSIPLKRKDRVIYGYLCIVDPQKSLENCDLLLDGELQTLLSTLYSFHRKQTPVKRFIAKSRSMQELLAKIAKVSRSNVPVLLQGESGCGKTEIAKLIHMQGPLKDQSYVSIHCNTIPEPLFESELFGHIKGAFTGANHSQKGLVELADGGSLFLDEVGELPLSIQGKLLRFIETGDYFQIGGRVLKNVKARIICATSKNLKKMIAEGYFRSEFFYRIAGIKLCVPPLSERMEDIPLLAKYFVEQSCIQSGICVKRFTPDALRFLLETHFPGNLRELANLVESAVVFTENSDITEEDLSVLHREIQLQPMPEDLTLKDARSRLERWMIEEAINLEKDINEAARVLGISRRSLFRKKRVLKVDG